jgi:hypothetical protein
MFNLSDEDIDVVQRAQHLLGLAAILRLRDVLTAALKSNPPHRRAHRRLR